MTILNEKAPQLKGNNDQIHVAQIQPDLEDAA